MTWFSSCSAPDLSDLKVPVLSHYILNRVFLDRGGHDDPVVQSYVHAFIVTVDRAVRAYNLGRALLFNYASSENRTVLLFEGLGEFETCITAAKRALLFAAKMAAHPENPEIPRVDRRLLDNHLSTLRPVRDAIEHLDDDLASGVGDDRPKMLAVSKDGAYLEIGPHQLSFVSLAKAVERIHDLATKLASRVR